VLVLVAFSLGGEDDSPAAVPEETATAGSTPDATLAPTPPPLPTPLPALASGVWPDGTQTGIAVVDKVIHLAEAKDAASLAQLVEFSTYPCEAPRPINPQPLVCGGGMSVGDPISGLWVTSYEGGLWPFDRRELEALFVGVLRENFRLHAVWEYQQGESALDRLPALRYAVIFAYRNPQTGVAFTSFNLSDTGFLWLAFDFPTPPAEAWIDPSAPGWILPRAE